jgi:hypothetical protein
LPISPMASSYAEQVFQPLHIHASRESRKCVAIADGQARWKCRNWQSQRARPKGDD